MLEGLARVLVQIAEVVSAIGAPPPAPIPYEPPATPPAVVAPPVIVTPEPNTQQPIEERIVSSTAYCLPGPTWGTVAMNKVPKGTRWEILDGTRAGDVVTVMDRIGHGSDFDLWYPSCRDARVYGRQQIRIIRLPD
jgi:hypothetical protein